MADKVALVVGVTGIVGLNLAQRLLKEGWTVYGISRRKPSYLPEKVKHVALDLTDESACKKKLAGVKDVTHIFYCTWVNKSTEEENCVINKLMVEYVLDNLGSKIKHFVLVTGTKQYLGSFSRFAEGEMQTPFKEDQPRHPYPNFYYDQEDVVFDRSANVGFTWSVARPHTIIGFAPNNKMNLGTSIAVYATICKHLDMPFIFPGGQKGYNIFLDVTGTDVLAEHLIWEATDPKAANQAFNVVNGDIFRWKTLWQVIADYFGLQVEEPPENALDMEKVMEDKGPVWDAIVEKHGLQKFKLEELTLWWWYVAADVGRSVSCINDMTKSRKMGFLRYQDTEQTFIDLFDFLRKNKYIP